MVFATPRCLIAVVLVRAASPIMSTLDESRHKTLFYALTVYIQVLPWFHHWTSRVSSTTFRNTMKVRNSTWRTNPTNLRVHLPQCRAHFPSPKGPISVNWFDRAQA